MTEDPYKKKENTTNSFLSQVTTIYSALLVFLHHGYIGFWWNHWRNHPYYLLWRQTRTQILVWKTRRGRGRGGRMHTHTHTHTDTLFPKPAITCLSGYLPAQPGAHLTARWVRRDRQSLAGAFPPPPSPPPPFWTREPGRPLLILVAASSLRTGKTVKI